MTRVGQERPQNHLQIYQVPKYSIPCWFQFRHVIFLPRVNLVHLKVLHTSKLQVSLGVYDLLVDTRPEKINLCRTIIANPEIVKQLVE